VGADDLGKHPVLPGAGALLTKGLVVGEHVARRGGLAGEEGIEQEPDQRGGRRAPGDDVVHRDLGREGLRLREELGGSILRLSSRRRGDRKTVPVDPAQGLLAGDEVGEPRHPPEVGARPERDHEL